jgi:hypothetical protein
VREIYKPIEMEIIFKFTEKEEAFLRALLLKNQKFSYSEDDKPFRTKWADEIAEMRKYKLFEHDATAPIDEYFLGDYGHLAIKQLDNRTAAEKFLDTPFSKDTPFIDGKTHMVLRIGGIKNPRQLLETTEHDLEKIQRCGKACIARIKQLLASQGFSLKE